MKTEHKLDRALDAVAKKGTEAWGRLKKGRSWADWLIVGEALIVLRGEAMSEAGVPAGTNKPPAGAAYSGAMSRLLERYKLHDLDKPTRSHLMAIMDDRKTIESWYATLPLSQRLNLNHPTAVMRRYERENRVPKPADPTKKTALQKTEEALAMALDRVQELERENAALKAHNEELQAAWDMKANALQQAKVKQPRKTRRAA